MGDNGRRCNPLFNRNRLKLGVFATNVSNGCAITLAEGRFETTWANTRAVNTLADQAGLEALVPVARWKGFGGPSNFNGTCFETFTWAAGLAAQTTQAAVFATAHVPTIHPIVAAKQGTTVDHISGGRFALNVVCGWFRPELEMFGAPVLEHDEAYAYAAEWLQVVRLLWTAEGEVDYTGRFFTIRRGFHEPKPVQRPFPPVMSAGSSPVGRRFAAQYADMAFTQLRPAEFEEARAEIAALRRLAREEFGRELQVWTTAYVVCRPTEREAREYLHYYVYERGDWEAVENLTRIMGMQKRHLTPARLEQLKAQFVAGWGGFPLVGTPEQIVEALLQAARVGVDGVTLSWVSYEAELRQWTTEVLPLLEQAGLREPVKRTDALSGRDALSSHAR
ncbi:MAG: LLM class flavin-dependent oxidoreductase [Chloroflexi bacterium]|nr:LLM class flavin-dependent oxidoreductase [Chloroflexota bacterium]